MYTPEWFIWRFLEIGVPLNREFTDGFSIINHPAIGVPPLLWKTPYATRKWPRSVLWRENDVERYPNTTWLHVPWSRLDRVYIYIWLIDAYSYIHSSHIGNPNRMGTFPYENGWTNPFDGERIRAMSQWASPSQYQVQLRPFTTYMVINIYIYTHNIYIYIYIIYMCVYTYTYIYIYIPKHGNILISMVIFNHV